MKKRRVRRPAKRKVHRKAVKRKSKRAAKRKSKRVSRKNKARSLALFNKRLEKKLTRLRITEMRREARELEEQASNSVRGNLRLLENAKILREEANAESKSLR